MEEKLKIMKIQHIEFLKNKIKNMSDDDIPIIRMKFNSYNKENEDPAEDPVPNSLALPEHTWRALHWDVWNSQDPLDPSPPPHAAQASATSLSPPSPAARKRRHSPTSRKRNRNTADSSQPTITQFFSAVSTSPRPHLSTTTPTSEIAVGPGSPQAPHD